MSGRLGNITILGFTMRKWKGGGWDGRIRLKFTVIEHITIIITYDARLSGH